MYNHLSATLATVTSNLKQCLIDTWASISQKSATKQLVNGETVLCKHIGNRTSFIKNMEHFTCFSVTAKLLSASRMVPAKSNLSFR